MSIDYILPIADNRAELETVGGKGASLARLCLAGMPVPGGFHVTTLAYNKFVEDNLLLPSILEALSEIDPAKATELEQASQKIKNFFSEATMPPEVAGAVARAYATLPGSDPPVAVRSSATAEDLPDLSFAGQQETYLNIHGVGLVQEAIQRCWASLWTPRAISYRFQHGIDQQSVSLAVVVQLLIPAEAAGILFTADPVSGMRDRVLISAAWGLGEAVVGGLVTPDSLTVEKLSGRVIERQTADKRVMTVRVDSHSEEQAVPDAMRRAPVLDDRAAAELSRLGGQIEDLYGMPMDIEWALADGEFAILQARPITALPEEGAPLPTEWIIPDPKATYMRGSLAEHLPNPVSPLFATLGVRLSIQETHQLMLDFMGKDAIFFDFQVINGYVYQGIRILPREMWKFTKATIKQVKPMLKGGKENWLAARMPFERVARQWEEKQVEDLSAAELLTGVRELYTESAHFYTVIQSGTLPTATSSETVFTLYYNKLVKRRGDPEATVFLFGIDTQPILAEKSLFDLAVQSRKDQDLEAYLKATPAEQIAGDLRKIEPPDRVKVEVWNEWRGRFQKHLQVFGHSVYEFDFINPVPAEAPEPLLEAIKMYLAGKGKDPYERQQAYAERREKATQAILSRLGWPRRGWFQKLLKWVQETGPVREDSLADMGLAHPQIRRLLSELGNRMVSGGAIQDAQDIYWLEEQEVETLVAALDGGKQLPNFAGIVPKRKAAWHAAQQVVPPTTLPESSKISMLIPWREKEAGDRTVLKGLGTSAGKVTARARVLLGTDDFSRMEPGDVLVAVTTTPAWTPLFAMASAVVTDIGGPLSHSSIVAREYGIPAVMATGAATRRIQDGQTITVDGAEGKVILL